MECIQKWFTSFKAIMNYSFFRIVRSKLLVRINRFLSSEMNKCLLLTNQYFTLISWVLNYWYSKFCFEECFKFMALLMVLKEKWRQSETSFIKSLKTIDLMFLKIPFPSKPFSKCFYFYRYFSDLLFVNCVSDYVLLLLMLKCFKLGPNFELYSLWI